MKRLLESINKSIQGSLQDNKLLSDLDENLV
jgi:hypothetical protein